MTKTEKLRRLRVLAAQGRIVARQKAGARVEVGSRLIPVRYDRPPTIDDVLYGGPDDDLRDFSSMQQFAGSSDDCQPGEIVHLYFSTTGDWGELQSIVTGWLGVEGHEPFITDCDGTRVVGLEKVRRS